MTTQFCLCLYLLTCASLALVFRPCTVLLDALSQLVNNSADGFTHFTSFPRSAVYQYWWAFLVLQCLRILLDPVQYFLVMEWHPFHIRLWSFNWLINGSCCCTELVGVVCLQLFQLLRVSPPTNRVRWMMCNNEISTALLGKANVQLPLLLLPECWNLPIRSLLSGLGRTN